MVTQQSPLSKIISPFSSDSSYSTSLFNSGLTQAAETVVITGTRQDGFLSFDNRIEQDLIQNRNSSTGSLPADKIAYSKEALGSNSICYPAELASVDYYTEIKFGKYVRPNALSKANTDVFYTVKFPLPFQLIENHSVNYNSTQYGATVGNVLNQGEAAIRNFVDKDKRDTRAIEAELGKTLAGNLYGLGKDLGLAGTLFGKFGTAAEGAFGQMVGAIPNPHLTVFFEGPSLRDHPFQWQFSPNNQDESIIIKDIFKKIKRYIHPKVNESDAHATLDYPSIVEIGIFCKGKKLYPIKKGVISSASLNYTATGSPAFYLDGTPVTMMLSIQFKEIEYLTSQDFDGDDDGAGIGSTASASTPLQPSGRTNYDPAKRPADSLLSNLEDIFNIGR